MNLSLGKKIQNYFILFNILLLKLGMIVKKAWFIIRQTRIYISFDWSLRIFGGTVKLLISSFLSLTLVFNHVFAFSSNDDLDKGVIFEEMLVEETSLDFSLLFSYQGSEDTEGYFLYLSEKRDKLNSLISSAREHINSDDSVAYESAIEMRDFLEGEIKSEDGVDASLNRISDKYYGWGEWYNYHKTKIWTVLTVTVVGFVLAFFGVKYYFNKLEERDAILTQSLNELEKLEKIVEDADKKYSALLKTAEKYSDVSQLISDIDILEKKFKEKLAGDIEQSIKTMEKISLSSEHPELLEYLKKGKEQRKKFEKILVALKDFKNKKLKGNKELNIRYLKKTLLEIYNSHKDLAVNIPNDIINLNNAISTLKDSIKKYEKLLKELQKVASGPFKNFSENLNKLKNVLIKLRKEKKEIEKNINKKDVIEQTMYQSQLLYEQIQDEIQFFNAAYFEVKHTKLKILEKEMNELKVLIEKVTVNFNKLQSNAKNSQKYLEKLVNNTDAVKNVEKMMGYVEKMDEDLERFKKRQNDLKKMKHELIKNLQSSEANKYKPKYSTWTPELSKEIAKGAVLAAKAWKESGITSSDYGYTWPDKNVRTYFEKKIPNKVIPLQLKIVNGWIKRFDLRKKYIKDAWDKEGMELTQDDINLHDDWMRSYFITARIRAAAIYGATRVAKKGGRGWFEQCDKVIQKIKSKEDQIKYWDKLMEIGIAIASEFSKDNQVSRFGIWAIFKFNREFKLRDFFHELVVKDEISQDDLKRLDKKIIDVKKYLIKNERTLFFK